MMKRKNNAPLYPMAVARQRAGYSQASAALAMEYSVDTISRVERGTVGASEALLRKMMALYGASADELLCRIPVKGDLNEFA